MFLPCPVFGSTWLAHKPHLGALLCSRAEGGALGWCFFGRCRAQESCVELPSQRDQLCRAGPAGLSQPPHALAPGPVPSSDVPQFPTLYLCHPGRRGVFEGTIHPLLMCRGRSWHGHSCDQNYSPKVQPWNFYCGSQSEKRERGGVKKSPSISCLPMVCLNRIIF